MLMITAEMIVGFIPLVIARGNGAISSQSIDIIIAAGITIRTIFTLFVISFTLPKITADLMLLEKKKINISLSLINLTFNLLSILLKPHYPIA